MRDTRRLKYENFRECLNKKKTKQRHKQLKINIVF